MEKFACKNLGLDCNFEASGATKEEVLGHAMEHGNAVHADMMKDMTEAQMEEFGKNLEASITSV